MKLSVALSLAVLAFFHSVSSAQAPPLTHTQQRAVVEKTIELVTANYVYPERAKNVDSVLRKNFQVGKYNTSVRVDDFLDLLNSDLQAAGMDRHLRVNHNPRVVAQLKQDAAGSDLVDPEFLKMLKERNFGLEKVATLDGNIGYFKFDHFVELRFFKDAFLGGLAFLSNSAAIILDLTDNGGGAAETSDALLDCFLPEGTVIGETWNRGTNQTTTSTITRLPEVKPQLDIPLYILVGERTASAAEATAYALQQSKRAVVVGSQTKGMANSGQLFPIDDRFYVMVPMILHKSAVSGTNWEGVGVTPDIKAVPDQALNSAMLAALTELAGRESDGKAKFKRLFTAQEYAALLAPQAPPAGFLDACRGEYAEGQSIAMEDGSLHYRKGTTNRKLNYMSDHTFLVEGRKDYRLHFHFDGSRVKECEVLWFDDTSDKYAKKN